MVGASLLTAGYAQTPGMPADVAQRVRAIGPVINPPETAKIYIPLLAAQTPVQVTVERDLAYGPDTRHRLDITRPAGAQSGAMPTASPLPVLVFVHGGAFVAGNKTAPDSPFYDNIARWAAANQMLVANMTYRLAPAHGWPAGREDITLAVEWLAKQVAVRGGDPQRLYLMGHSAGASHVASVLADAASRQRIRQAGFNLAGGLLISAVYDYPAMPDAAGNKAYLGNNFALYAERSPGPGLLDANMRLLLVRAELDPPDFRTQYDNMVQALRQRGQSPVLVDLPGHSHMSEIQAIGTEDRSLTDPMLAFIRGR